MNPGSTRTRPARLRDRLREEADRAILTAAEEVFSEEGLGARMERIAVRAGVAVGTLYTHFQDRSALVEALSTSRREALVARLDAASAAVDGRPFREQIGAFLGAVAEHARAHGRLLSAFVEGGEGPARCRPRDSLLDALVARADALIARGIDAGELRPEGRALYGTALIGMVRALLVPAVRGAAGWDAISELLPALFLDGAHR